MGQTKKEGEKSMKEVADTIKHLCNAISKECDRVTVTHRYAEIIELSNSLSRLLQSMDTKIPNDKDNGAPVIW